MKLSSNVGAKLLYDLSKTCVASKPQCILTQHEFLLCAVPARKAETERD